MKEISKKTTIVRMFATGFAGFLLIGNLFSINGKGIVSKAAKHAVQNPISMTDSSLRSGMKVTYDTVFLGSYPQSEVKASDPMYSRLQAVTNWDICGDTIIEGTKYRRLNQSEALGCTLDLENWIYDDETNDYIRVDDYAPGVGADGYSHWEDNDTYHYFRFEPIRWRVLDTDGDKALLLSDIAIDARATDIYQWTRPNDPTEERTIDGVRYQNINSTWDNCELRSWLNSYDASHNYYKVNCSGNNEKSFYNVAFSSGEKPGILTTSLRNEGGGTSFHDSEHWEYTVGGRDTEDKVFLLSYWDVLRNYGFSTSADVMDEARKCNVSDYTVSRGLYANADDGAVPRDQWSVQWGLRTSTDGVSFWYGSDRYAAIEKNGKRYVQKNSDGSVNNYGDWVGRVQGVRPAIMIDLSSNAYIYAGTYCSDGTYSDGTLYSLDGCDHSRNLRHVDAEAATYDSVGHEEYWICDMCGKIFADEHGLIETTYFNLAIPKLTRETNTTVPVVSSSPAPTASAGGAGALVPKATASAVPSATPTTKPSVSPSTEPSATPSASPEADTTMTPEVTTTPITSEKPIESTKSTSVTSDGVKYVVKDGEMIIKEVKNQKSIRIHKLITIGGKTYRVTKISKKLFAGKKRVKRIILDVSYIKSIGKHAFVGVSDNASIVLKGSRKRRIGVRTMIVKSGLPESILIKF